MFIGFRFPENSKLADVLEVFRFYSLTAYTHFESQIYKHSAYPSVVYMEWGWCVSCMMRVVDCEHRIPVGHY